MCKLLAPKGASKNSEFAQVSHKGTPIRYGLKHRAESSARREGIFAAPHMRYMQARKFPSNAAVGMKSGFLDSSHLQVINPRHHIPILGFLAIQLDIQAQVVERIRILQRFLVTDFVCFVQVEQRLIEGLHADFARL